MGQETVNRCCLAREIEGRLERARAIVLRDAMLRIARAKSLDAATALARDAVLKSDALALAPNIAIPLVRDPTP